MGLPNSTVDGRPSRRAHVIAAVVLLLSVLTAVASPTAAAATAPTDDAEFVTDVYRGLLGRAPDAGGLDHWVGRLEAGASRSVVVAGIGDAAEQRRLVVTRAYRDLLDRAPDPSGTAFWSERVIDRISDRRLRAGILGSAEFFDKAGGTDAEFVDALYREVLRRSPDAAGRQYWLAQIAGGLDRGSVARRVLASVEEALGPTLSVVAAEPRPDTIATSVERILLTLDRDVDAEASAVIVSVDGTRVPGVTRAVAGADDRIEFVASQRPVLALGTGSASVVVTVFAHDGDGVVRTDLEFRYRPDLASVPPSEELIVAFYGHPRAPVLGVAGEGTPAEALARLLDQARPYAASGRTVVPAFEMISTLVTAAPGADGLYRSRASIDELRPYLDTIRSANGRLILDIQPGRADVLDEAMAYEELLIEPEVGLALDPEWVVGPDQTPAGRIGTLDAADINRVSAYLDELSARHALPPRLLIIHRFQPSMVTNTDAIVSRPGVRILFHADGEGGPGAKIADYDTLLPPRFERGIKIFYDEDVDRMTPDEVLARLDPDPSFVSYQ